MKTRNLCSSTTALSLAALAVFAVACAPSNPKLIAPGVPVDAVESSLAVPPETRSVPTSDVLIVVDASESMLRRGHIRRLQENAPRFAAAFAAAAANASIRVGVVTAFDSVSPRAANCTPIGKLRPLRDPNCPTTAVPGPQFVTTSTGTPPICSVTTPQTGAPAAEVSSVWGAILGRTLALDAEPSQTEGRRANGEAFSEPGCGAELEEFFTPILPALSEIVNPGFYRANAHLGIVIITDAKGDASSIEPEKLAEDLYAMKGGRRDLVSTYGVLALNSSCIADQSGRAGSIEKFLEVTGGQAFSLCDDDWGTKLGNIGAALGAQAAQAERLSMVIAGRPRPEELRVFCGSREIPRDSANGWYYDAATHTVSASLRMLRAIPGCTVLRASSDQVRIEELRRTMLGGSAPAGR